MSKRILATTMIGVLSAAVVFGCATGPQGPTDEEQIMAQLQTLKAGVLGKNIEQVVDVVSAEFYHPGLGDKEGALDLIRQGMDMGIVDEGEIDLELVAITVDGEKATAGPIEASNPMASATVEFTFKKEDGVWRITGGEATGF